MRIVTKKDLQDVLNSIEKFDLRTSTILMSKEDWQDIREYGRGKHYYLCG